MDSLADKDWRLIREERRVGPMQMALDEVAAETAGSGDPWTVRVYTWEPSTLSLGYHQASGSVDWEYCSQEGIGVTRRPTGGGGIYHDATGDISYSIAVPQREVPGKLMDCYELLCTPVLDAFERMNVDVGFAEEKRAAIHQPCCYLRAIHPAHDILASGRKISGNAQYRQREAVIQHGSLSYALNPERHLGVFSEPETSPEEYRARVTAIREESGISRAEAISALEEALADWCDAEDGSWSSDELERAEAIADEKYGTDEWNRKRVDPMDH